MDELNRCPFCGSTVLNEDYELKPEPGVEVGWYVECNGCLARGPMKPTMEEAEAAWNRRR